MMHVEGFEHIEHAIAEIAAGKAVVVVDDEDAVPGLYPDSDMRSASEKHSSRLM